MQIPINLLVKKNNPQINQQPTTRRYLASTPSN